MAQVKLIEFRDEGTLIPFAVVRVCAYEEENLGPRWLTRRAGWGAHDEGFYLIDLQNPHMRPTKYFLVRGGGHRTTLVTAWRDWDGEGYPANYDLRVFNPADTKERTEKLCLAWVAVNWPWLQDGGVVDAEFVMKRKNTIKESERREVD